MTSISTQLILWIGQLPVDDLKVFEPRFLFHKSAKASTIAG